jgi:hypothetical protein
MCDTRYSGCPPLFVAFPCTTSPACLPALAERPLASCTTTTTTFSEWTTRVGVPCMWYSYVVAYLLVPMLLPLCSLCLAWLVPLPTQRNRASAAARQGRRQREGSGGRHRTKGTHENMRPASSFDASAAPVASRSDPPLCSRAVHPRSPTVSRRSNPD